MTTIAAALPLPHCRHPQPGQSRGQFAEEIEPWPPCHSQMECWAKDHGLTYRWFSCVRHEVRHMKAIAKLTHHDWECIFHKRSRQHNTLFCWRKSMVADRHSPALHLREHRIAERPC